MRRQTTTLKSSFPFSAAFQLLPSPPAPARVSRLAESAAQGTPAQPARPRGSPPGGTTGRRVPEGAAGHGRPPVPPGTPWPPPAPPDRPLVSLRLPPGHPRPLCEPRRLRPENSREKAPPDVGVGESPDTAGSAVPIQGGNGRSLGQLCFLQISSCDGSGALCRVSK